MNTSQKSSEKNGIPPNLSMLETKFAETWTQIARLQYQLICSDMTNEDIDDIREQLSLLRRVEKAIKTELITVRAKVGGNNDTPIF